MLDAALNRQVVIVPVNALLLANMVRGDEIFYFRGDIPANAECVGVTYDVVSNSIELHFAHDSFPLRVDGQPPAVRLPSMTIIE